METNLFQASEKCLNYTVLGSVVLGTINVMSRFKNVPRERILTKIYSKLKEQAGK